MAKKESENGIDLPKLNYFINVPKGCAQVSGTSPNYRLQASGSGPDDGNGNFPHHVYVNWFKGTGAVPASPPGGSINVALDTSNNWTATLSITPDALGIDCTCVAWYVYGFFPQIRMIESSIFRPQTSPCPPKAKGSMEKGSMEKGKQKSTRPVKKR